MEIDELKLRPAPRVQAIVCRDGKVLMASHEDEDGSVWCIPGGALEEGETPEEGALRELREEAGVEGRIVALIGQGFSAQGEIDTYTYWVDIGDQEPSLGHDPELEGAETILVDIQWKALSEVPERDRVFLWRAGLLSVPGIFDEVRSWGDEVSYPDDGYSGQGSSS